MKRKQLPRGVWNVRSQNENEQFRLVAECKYPIDKVDALVLLGAPSPEMYEEWDLPDSPTLSRDNHWHFHLLEYRVARAAGGTRALLFWLTQEANKHWIWITVRVHPQHVDREKMIAQLFQEYGFQSSPLRDYRYMLRKPV